MKKIAVVGLRSIDELGVEVFYDEMNSIDWSDKEIVTGDATGVDRLARQFANDKDIYLQVYEADWYSHGKAAGPIRNTQIVEYADAMIAFWDGRSKGTGNAIMQMKKLRKPVKIVHVESNEISN